MSITTSALKPFMCKNCSSRFRAKAALNRHKTMVHKKKINPIQEKSSIKKKVETAKTMRSTRTTKSAKKLIFSEESIEKLPKEGKTDEKGRETVLKLGKGAHRSGKRRSKTFKDKTDEKVTETVVTLGKGISRGGKRRSKTFKCQDCDSTFNSPDKLKRHNEFQHVSPKCKICEVNFVNQKALSIHMENQQLCTASKSIN